MRKRKATKPKPGPGYYLDVIHETPAGEDQHTLVLWQNGRPTAKKLAEWAEAYRRVLRDRKHVALELGFIPDPVIINAKPNNRDRVVVSWGQRG